jgi:hypothetical protein
MKTVKQFLAAVLACGLAASVVVYSARYVGLTIDALAQRAIILHVGPLPYPNLWNHHVSGKFPANPDFEELRYYWKQRTYVRKPSASASRFAAYHG